MVTPSPLLPFFKKIAKMSINSLIPAFKSKKDSIQRMEYSTPTSPSPPLEAQKDRILTGITDREHLLTLLGMACQLIGELTNDRAFYEEAKRRARCRGMAENHLPSKIERWEQLQKEIESTTGNYHLETDSTLKHLHHLILDAQCKQQEQLTRDLEAQGLQWTPQHGWTRKKVSTANEYERMRTKKSEMFALAEIPNESSRRNI